jgi:ABC-2 type transport system permease protein
MRNFLIVLKYTILENARKKSFIITNVILVLLTILLFNISNIADALNNSGVSEGDNTVQKIVIVDDSNIYSDSLNNFNIPNTTYTFIKDENKSLDELKNELDKGEISAVVLMDEKDSIPTFKYLVQNTNSNISANVTLVSDVIKSTYMNIVLSKYNVSNTDLININSPITYKLEQVSGKETDVSVYFIAIITSLLLYFAVYFYGYSVSMSISNEKTSRVMETLITSTKPTSIVVGKTVAMGVLGLAQLLLIILTGLISYRIFVAGNLVIMGQAVNFGAVTIPILILLIIYFLLGYFLYAMLNAVTGATVSKAEDIHSAAMPVTFVSLISFYLGYFSLITPDSPMTAFASIFPFSSAFTMPSRMLLSDVPVSQIILSIVLLIGTIMLLAYISIRIYSAAILYYGQKLKLKDWFKMSKNN